MSSDLVRIEVAVVDSVTDDNLSEALIGIGDAVLDSMFENDVLQNIPYLGILFKGAKAMGGIRDQIFAKKVLKFLIHIQKTNPKQRKEFIAELEGKTKQKAGETLVILLDRLDSLEKTRIIANLFIAKVTGQITLDNFLRLSGIIERAFLYDLNEIPDQVGVPFSYKPGITESLFSLGLLYPEPPSRVLQQSLDPMSHRNDNSGNTYKVGQTAVDLLRYGLRNQ